VETASASKAMAKRPLFYAGSFAPTANATAGQHEPGNEDTEVGKEEAIPSALDAGCAGLTHRFAINHFVIRQAIEVRL